MASPGAEDRMDEDDDLDKLDDVEEELPASKRARLDSPLLTKEYEVAQNVAQLTIAAALEMYKEEIKAERVVVSDVSSDSAEPPVPADAPPTVAVIPVVVKKDVDLKTNASQPLPMKKQMDNLVQYEVNGSLRAGYDADMAKIQGTSKCERALVHVCPVLR